MIYLIHKNTEEFFVKSNLTAEAEVISLLVSIEKFIPVMEAQRQSAAAVEAELKGMIDEYEQARFNLFKNRLQREEKGWCTIGNHLVPLSGLKFLFLTGKRWHTSHESDSLREYVELRRACPTCYRKDLEMSGSTDGSAYHFAFVAKKIGKTFLYKKHGSWLSAPNTAKLQEIPSYALTKKLAAELGLPKEISYTSCPFSVIIEN